MNQRVIIRADGGTSIGMGHIVRCVALADMLIKDFNVAFAVQSPNEDCIHIIHTVTEEIIKLPSTSNYSNDADTFIKNIDNSDIIVLDGYHFNGDYQKKIKQKGCKLVYIDDLHSGHYVADAIINHADGIDEGLYDAEPYTKLLLGLDYALLRKPFLNKPTEKKVDSVEKAFISMGAADINNLTKKFTEALLEIETITEIHLMVGAINPHLNELEALKQANPRRIRFHLNISAEELAELLRSCDMAICPASSISLECCAIGIGLISGYTADNQLGILEGLKKHEAAISIGDMNQITIPEIKESLEALIKDTTQLNTLIENQKKMLDGKSPDRIVALFNSLKKEEIYFRLAKLSDAEIYFNWANDALVRENSFNSTSIEYQQHMNWFTKKLNSKTCLFYLFLTAENTPVGQVRIDKGEAEEVISISIDKNFRGKSIGKKMLEDATTDYLKRNPKSTITAYIKQSNVASYAIFKKAGFTNEETVMEQGIKSFKLYKQAKG